MTSVSCGDREARLANFDFVAASGGSVDGGKGISGGGIFAKQPEGSTAHNQGADNAGNAGGQQPAMMDGFVVKGIVKVCFKLIKGNGRALNANRFSLPVIRYFTVALQYRCPLALNTNVGSSFWATPPFSRKLAQIYTICQSLDTPPCD